MVRFLRLIFLANIVASVSSKSIRRILSPTAALADVNMTAEASLKQLYSMGGECLMDTVTIHKKDGNALLKATQEYFLSLETLDKDLSWSLDDMGVPKAETVIDFSNTFSDRPFKDYEHSCFRNGGMMCLFNIWLKGEIMVPALGNLGLNFNGTDTPGCYSKTCKGVDVSNLTDVGIPQAMTDYFDISLDNLAYNVEVDKCHFH